MQHAFKIHSIIQIHSQKMLPYGYIDIDIDIRGYAILLDIWIEEKCLQKLMLAIGVCVSD